MRAWIGLALTALAGWVDAIGYLRLGGLFPSFMSGNTTQLGVAVSGTHWMTAALPALLIGLFVAGAFVGTLIGEARTQWRIASCFLLESLLLGTALGLALHQPNLELALAPLPIAMGLQNAFARSFEQAGTGITFVTGTLVRLGQELARAVRREEKADWPIQGLTWLAMAAGAAGGAAAHIAFGPLALAVPAAGAAIGAMIAAAAVLRRRGSTP